MKRTLLALLISVALIVPSLAASADGAKNVETVGGFAVKLAAALGRSPATPEAAAASLKKAGVNNILHIWCFVGNFININVLMSSKETVNGF